MADTAGLGVRLRRAREAARLSQKAAAGRIGTSQSRVSEWERDIHKPGAAVLARLAKLYGVSMEVLVSENSGNTVSRETPDGIEPYTPIPALRRELPPRAYTVLLGYLRRLEGIGLTHDELARMETLLARDRYGQRFSQRGTEPLSEDDIIKLLEGTWQAISESLALRGPRP